MAHASLSLSSALAAAESAAGGQHYPQGTLYVVATPIGNLADMGLRALHLLRLADAVACEDTRHTGALLQAFGLHKPLIAVHQHNEAAAAEAVLLRLRAGERVALVSDAGTPGVSDPGARVCAALQAAGMRCVPVPGASSVTALLSVAGLPPTDSAPAFEFTGFLPARGAERAQALQRLAQQAHACVLLEAPHRIGALADDLRPFGERRLTVGRELTKQFEEITTLACADFAAWLAAAPTRSKGEFALVLHPLPHGAQAEGELSASHLRALDLLLAELPLKTAVRLCSELTGAPRNALYQRALQRKRDTPSSAED